MSWIKKIITFITTRPWFRYSLVGGIFRNTFDERAQMMEMAMKYTFNSKLHGDYFEFGSHLGKSMVDAYHLSKKFLPNISFYIFDSFEGLPKVESMNDKNIFQQFGAGEFRTSEKKFKENLRKGGVNLSRVHTVPGWYKDTLNERTRKEIGVKKVAVVNIDCDLYESAKLCLDFITAFLEDGTLIIFDDWFTYRGNPNRGEQKAFSEWLEKNPNISATEYRKFAWAGNSFIVHLS
jgi:O-methyltransferase